MLNPLPAVEVVVLLATRLCCPFAAQVELMVAVPYAQAALEAHVQVEDIAQQAVCFLYNLSIVQENKVWGRMRE